MVVDGKGKIFEDRRGRKKTSQNKTEKESSVKRKRKTNFNRREEDKKK